MTEDQLQAQCYQWFYNTYPQHRQMLFAVPNGGDRDIRTASKLKATGVVGGVADMVLVRDQGRTAWIELKIPGGRQSQAQEEFEVKLILRQHHYFIIYSFEEFKQLIWTLIGK